MASCSINEMDEAGEDLNSTTMKVQSSFETGSKAANNEDQGMLMRCTSTPLNNGNEVKKAFFVSPNNYSADSGIDSISSEASFLESQQPNKSSGAISKRTKVIITRSRSRRWSGTVESSCTPSTSSFLSIKSFDLRQFPKNDSGLDMEMSFFKRSRVVVYRPGLFEGRERLDLIKRLNDMQTYHILAMVWKHLSAEDLGRVLQVSTSWNTAILMDKYSMEKYVAAKERISENTLAHKQIQERMRLSKTSPRKALTSVSNLLLTPVKTENRRSPRLANSPTSSGGSQKRGIDELSKPMIVSPSKFRHRLFTEEAQRLGPDEKLQPCPRCTCPSRVIPSEDRACCSRISCQFNFCTLCMCTYHHDSPCRITRGCKMKGTTSPTSSPSNASSGCSSTKARVSSKQSKSRLKRL